MIQKKIGKKIQKIKKPSYGFFSSQNRWEKAEKKRKKKICRSVPFPSDRTGNRKFQKKKKEIQKNEKIPL